MDITPYVDRIREGLQQSAAAGDADIRAAAERLGHALEPTVRLGLMEVLSEATAEITSAMRSGSVETRLQGRDVEFVVSGPAPAAPTPPSPPPPPGEEETDEGALARITVRLPESIKNRAEELAARGGHSLNTWIVNTLRTATREHAVNIDIDLSSLPFLDNEFPGGRGFPSGGRGNRRMTGWI